MKQDKTRTTLLLNWRTTPYHTPIILGNYLGFYQEEGVELAIIEPHNPSDVPEIVGTGAVDLGLKAIIHCYAVKGRGFPIKSIGTLLEEPFTGLIYLKSTGIKTFDDLRGKRLGFVGHFGKIMIDDLARRAGFSVNDYETVRIGMNVVDAIKRDKIDAGIGIGCHHRIELEETCGDAGMLRIDELAGLGCCCFCSIQIICSEKMLESQSDKVRGFLKATQRAVNYVLDQPELAFEQLCEARPELNSALQHKIFFNTIAFFTRTLENVERDWKKVHKYAQHLGVITDKIKHDDIYTNAFLPVTPYSKLAALPVDLE
ncbi:MAG: ABC transporter substrate-binding protein [Gammaproteobacteria bacterium]|nr:ABC transporter substrate-binding protein [Gammaproteobacteria bacterium]